MKFYFIVFKKNQKLRTMYIFRSIPPWAHPPQTGGISTSEGPEHLLPAPVWSQTAAKVRISHIQIIWWLKFYFCNIWKTHWIPDSQFLINPKLKKQNFRYLLEKLVLCISLIVCVIACEKKVSVLYVNKKMFKNWIFWLLKLKRFKYVIVCNASEETFYF